MTVDVVMIPGFLCDERLFEQQVVALRAHPTVGSVAVADIRSQSTIETMAAAVLADAPTRFAVAGLSLGAIVAAEIAAAAPRRVTGIALLSTNLAEPDAVQLETRRRWAADVGAGRFEQVVADHLIEPLTIDPSAHGPVIAAMANRAGADTFMQQNQALLHRRDRRDDLASISVPVLIASGREDQLCPPSLHDDLAARIPHAHRVTIEGAGHLCTIDQPHELSDVLLSWATGCENNQPLPTGGISNAYITT